MAVVLGAIGRFLRGQRMGWLLILWCGRRIFYGILTPVQPYKGACRQVFASVPAAPPSVKGCVNRWDRGRVWRGNPLAEWVVFESEPAGRFGKTASRFLRGQRRDWRVRWSFRRRISIGWATGGVVSWTSIGEFGKPGLATYPLVRETDFLWNPHPGSAV